MLKNVLSKYLGRQNRQDQFPNLSANVLEVRSLEYLQKAMGWTCTPILKGEHLTTYQFLEDLNDRRLRDAEVIASACCNGTPKTLLEIGTSHGRTTALMAQNAVNGTIHTVNIPPDDIDKGGRNITFAPELSDIGSYYRDLELKNIRQIYANTAHWEPDFGPIDVAFIDGCHDAEFVYGDTAKVLKRCQPGSLILWHDFNPNLVNVYGWIKEVCQGVERLYAEGILKGRILHLQDSWVGLYLVESE